MYAGLLIKGKVAFEREQCVKLDYTLGLNMFKTRKNLVSIKLPDGKNSKMNKKNVFT